ASISAKTGAELGCRRRQHGRHYGDGRKEGPARHALGRLAGLAGGRSTVGLSGVAGWARNAWTDSPWVPGRGLSEGKFRGGGVSGMSASIMGFGPFWLRLEPRRKV